MTKTWKIADREIKGQTVLAPLAGIGDGPFRRICKRYGASLIYTEFISAQGLIHKNKHTQKMLQLSDDERPVNVQLFGPSPEVLAKGARFVEDAGADFIDLNCGCPEMKVVKTGSGSALMNDPALIARIVEAMVREVKIPVTVKTRIGTKRGLKEGLEIARLVQDAGASAFAINCIYVAQGFNAPYYWEFIDELKQILKIPIIANGGIKTLLGVQDVLSRGASAVMIGRGCIGAPWIFKKLNNELEGLPFEEPKLEERFSVMMDHLYLEVEDKGEEIGINELRKHWAWYAKGLPMATKFRQQAMKQTSVAGMEKLLVDYKKMLEDREVIFE